MNNVAFRVSLELSSSESCNTKDNIDFLLDTSYLTAVEKANASKSLPHFLSHPWGKEHTVGTYIS